MVRIIRVSRDTLEEIAYSESFFRIFLAEISVVSFY